MSKQLIMMSAVIALALFAVTTTTTATAAYAAKLTKTSFDDGFNSGVRDGQRDAVGANGHGFDKSCPKGHTNTFCNGYEQGYDAGFFGRQSNGAAASAATANAGRGSGGSASSSSSSTANSNNNNKFIIIK